MDTIQYIANILFLVFFLGAGLVGPCVIASFFISEFCAMRQHRKERKAARAAQQ